MQEMKTIPQRELRNNAGTILRRAERGERFTITVGGRPVAELGPLPKRTFVPKEDVLRAFRGIPPDPTLFDDIADAMGTELVEDPWVRRRRR